jgi:hypothetical protein
LLQGLKREFDLTIEPVDISDDQTLWSKYWDKIPVLDIDGRTTLAAPIRVAEVRAILNQIS